MAATILKQTSFEGGTNTTPVSTGNSGGASGDAWDAVSTGTSNTNAYTTSSPINGSVSVNWTKNSTNQLLNGWTFATAQSDFSFRITFTFPSGNLATDEPIIRLYSGSGYTPQIGAWSLLSGSGRKSRVSDTTNGNNDSSASLAQSTQYTAVGRWISGTSLTVTVFQKGTATVAATSTVTAASDSVNSVRIGLTGSGNSAVTVKVDDIAIGYGGDMDRVDYILGSGDVASTATLTAAGGTSGSATVSPSVSITASGSLTTLVGSASVSETVGITAAGAAQGSASRSSTASLTATGAAAGSGAVSESVSITAAGQGSASAVVSESVSITAAGAATGTAGVSPSVSLSASGNLSATGSATVAETVTIAAAGGTSGSGSRSETVAITASGQTSGTAARTATVTITASGALGNNGSADRAATATITASGGVSGSASVSESVSITAFGGTSAAASLTAAVPITATGYLSASGSATQTVTVAITADGYLDSSEWVGPFTAAIGAGYTATIEDRTWLATIGG